MLDGILSKCYHLDFVQNELHNLKQNAKAILLTLKCSYDFLLNFKVDYTL